VYVIYTIGIHLATEVSTLGPLQISYLRRLNTVSLLRPQQNCRIGQHCIFADAKLAQWNLPIKSFRPYLGLYPINDVNDIYHADHGIINRRSYITGKRSGLVLELKRRLD